MVQFKPEIVQNITVCQHTKKKKFKDKPKSPAGADARKGNISFSQCLINIWTHILCVWPSCPKKEYCPSLCFLSDLKANGILMGFCLKVKRQIYFASYLFLVQA